MNMNIEQRDFKVSIPTADGEAITELVKIQIPMEWDTELEEWLMTEEGLKQVEDTKAQFLTNRHTMKLTDNQILAICTVASTLMAILCTFYGLYRLQI